MTASAQHFRVMTYNIRYDNSWDTANSWQNRKDAIVGLIQKHQPQIIATQEGLHRQVDFIDSSLTSFSYRGIGREDGDKQGEYCAIFYDTTEFHLLKDSTFWLSETPEKISAGWDAALERICTWALFESKINQSRFWVFNTHFDHKGALARERSSYLIIEKINTYNRQVNYPMILLGDLNARPDEKPIMVLNEFLKDAKQISQTPPAGPVGTFNGFDPDSGLEKRIDYVFTKGFEVLMHHTINDRLSDNFPSDHLPVMVEVKIPGKK